MLENFDYKTKAPFPYFGGKSQIVGNVWDALGNVKHYIEPFFGSGAVLLSRPSHHTGGVETVNDADGFVANVWRALQANPDAVAKRCDWPVNHADLMARKAALIRNENYLLENLCRDEKWFDAELAGYWIWAASCWIGSGLTSPGQRPHLSCGGTGVHAKGKRPHLSNGGTGVHAKGRIPHISDGGKGVQEPYNTNIYKWFRELSERLRYVRVVCGDWSRVCGGNWQTRMGVCGIFFDPPYSHDDRNDSIYQVDSMTVAKDVGAWALERGSNPLYRIVIAGYQGEHDALLSAGWTETRWKANGGYANAATKDDSEAKGKQNKLLETLWFSPHCRMVAHIENATTKLFSKGKRKK